MTIGFINPTPPRNKLHITLLVPPSPTANNHILRQPRHPLPVTPRKCKPPRHPPQHQRHRQPVLQHIAPPDQCVKVTRLERRGALQRRREREDRRVWAGARWRIWAAWALRSRGSMVAECRSEEEEEEEERVEDDGGGIDVEAHADEDEEVE
ncbi:hypothetical protein ACRE_044500 [Hapsidospora chrysogenum ATCC 11550]|uniref:Uncharacterized protein n=1 Tax=Hapsidospora chrysogenum (strain ATCC 11550 / CBS 779.69 / DSM 880 / IAM 14645 / JCM 23072 / IMI 49137) TaxID=857340 RepID=A0A086T5U0_HAPC1|nr:hypothetical protein ACRE_044500 [Hapsidospora chrysogenum ATCC 11550]